MSSRRTAYLVFQGAVYKEALEVTKKDFKRRYDEPKTQKQQEEVKKVKEKVLKHQRRYDEPEPSAGEQESRKYLDEYMKRWDKESETPLTDKLAPRQTTEIALNFSKIAPIWYALSEYATKMEQELNQTAKVSYEKHAKELLRWFTTLAAKSQHADVRAVGKLLAQTPSAHNLFSYNPPVYKQMRKYFDEGLKESDTAIRRFIRRINQVAKEQGWNIHS